MRQVIRANFAGAFVLLAVASRVLADSAEGGAYLDNLRKFDAAILDKTSLDAKLSRPTPGTGDSERFRSSIRVTNDGSSWTARQRPDSTMAQPKYAPRPTGPLTSDSRSNAMDYDEKGNFLIYRSSDTITLSEPDFSGIWYERTLFEVHPDGQVIEHHTKPSVELHNPGQVLDSIETYVTVLTAGRGYSRLIDDVKSVKSGAGKTILLSATGRCPDGTAVDWDLTVDPEAGYLVRDAICARPSGGASIAHFSNEGLKWSDRGALAEKGTFVFDPQRNASKPEMIWTFSFQGLSETDTRMIEEARELLRKPYPDGVSVADFRKGPTPKHNIVGENAATPYEGNLKIHLNQQVGSLTGSSPAETTEGEKTSPTLLAAAPAPLNSVVDKRGMHLLRGLIVLLVLGIVGGATVLWRWRTKHVKSR